MTGRNTTTLIVVASLLALLKLPSFSQAQGGTDGDIWELLLDVENKQNLPEGSKIDIKGSYTTGSGVDDYVGESYIYSSDRNFKASFSFTVPEPDYYEVFVTFPVHENRVNSMIIDYTRDYLPGQGSRTTVYSIDQTTGKVGPGLWHRLDAIFIEEYVGTFTVTADFSAGGKFLSVDAMLIRRGIVRDSEDTDVATSIGDWQESQRFDGFLGDKYFFKHKDVQSPDFSFTLRPPVPEEDYYAVFLNSHGADDRARNVPVTIRHQKGVDVVLWDQVQYAGRFFFLGSYPFVPNNDSMSIRIGTEGTEGFYVIVDAILLTRHDIIDTEHSRHVEILGEWKESTVYAGFSGSHYIHSNFANEPGKKVIFNADIVRESIYEIALSYAPADGRPDRAPIRIVTSTGQQWLTFINQRQPHREDGFTSIGHFSLPAGRTMIIVEAEGMRSFTTAVIADAVKLTPRHAFTKDSVDSDVTLSGNWGRSGGVPGFLGDAYFYSSSGTAVYPFRDDLLGLAQFDVYAAYTEHPNRAEQVEYRLSSAFYNAEPATLNHQQDGGQWRKVASSLFGFRSGSVSFSAVSGGNAVADGIKFVHKVNVPHVGADTDDYKRVTINGDWKQSSYITGFLGDHYLHDENADKGIKSVEFTLDVPRPGRYGFFVTYSAHPNRASNAPYRIVQNSAKVDKTVLINQQTAASEWTQHGSYNLERGDVKIIVSNKDTDGYVIVDAVLLVMEEETCDGITTVFDDEQDPEEIVKRCRLKEACEPGTFRAARDLCLPCPRETYSTSKNAPFCRDAQTCAPGTFVKTEYSPTSDRVCEPCPPNSFSAANSSAACVPCTTCRTGTFIARNCSAFQDAICLPLTRCEPGYFVEKQSNGFFDNKCKACRTCLAGTFERHLCQADHDAVCEACDDDSFTDQPNQRICQPFKQCTAGEFVALEGTHTSDRMCQTCDAGKTDDDRIPFTICKGCGAGYHVPRGSAGPCSTYICPAGTVDHDSDPATECEPCAPGTFQPMPGQVNCQPAQDCGQGQEELVAPTSLADRICQRCINGETFKAEAGSQTSCQDVRVCGPGFEQSSEPTISSDRECRPCEQGVSFKNSTDTKDACIPVTECDYDAFEYELMRPSLSTDRGCGFGQAAVIVLEMGSLPTVPPMQDKPTRLDNGFEMALRAQLAKTIGDGETDIVRFQIQHSAASRNQDEKFILVAVAKSTATAKAVADIQTFRVSWMGDSYEFAPEAKSVRLSPTTMTPTTEASGSGGEGMMSMPTATGVIIACCIFIAFVVLVVVLMLRRRSDQGSSKPDRDRPSLSFENPVYEAGEEESMYHQPHRGDNDFAPGQSEDGIYHDIAAHPEEGYMDVHGLANDDDQGYMTVNAQPQSDYMVVRTNRATSGDDDDANEGYMVFDGADPSGDDGYADVVPNEEEA